MKEYLPHMARPILHQEKGVWDMATEQFAACTMKCIPVTVQYTRYLKYVIIKRKLKI